jgi:uncharacterized membrane protein YidH (DUF202 family)
MLPKIFDLITGICMLAGGISMLWQLPNYQRRVEAGKIQRDQSRPSFKTLRRVAIGLVIVGVLMVSGWAFNLF